MSTKVVPAPADQAKRPVRSDKPANQTDEQQAVQQDEERPAKDDSDNDVSLAALVDAHVDGQEMPVVEGEGEEAVSETSLAGEFSFGGALAEAAASSGSLITEAEAADSEGYAQFGDGSTGTVLLVGAVALVALGIVLLVDDGGKKNEAPTVNASQDVTTAEDTAVDVTVDGSDPDGDALTYTAGSASNGTVTGGAGGAFTYTPGANFNGSDSFTVTVTDPDGLTATQTVNVTVTAVDDVFAFGAESADIEVNEDDVFSGDLSAFDVDGDTTFALDTQAANGTAVVNADGTYTYTPNADFNGTDSYVVSGADGTGADTLTVNVTVLPVNDAPDFGVEEQTFDIGQDTTLDGTLVATDIDGDALTYGVDTDPTNGTLTVGAGGALSYVPDAGYLGADSFVVTVDDGNGGTDTLTINVNILEDVTTEVSIDVPPAGDPIVFDAADGEIIFTDDIGVRTDVVIHNFAADDIIEVTGGAKIDDPSDYSFTATATSIVITFNDGVDFSRIVLDDLVGPGDVVFDYQTAMDVVGFDFITIA